MFFCCTFPLSSIKFANQKVVEKLKLLVDVSLFRGSCCDEIFRRELRYFQRGRFANDISDAQAGTLALSLARKNLSQPHSEY